MRYIDGTRKRRHSEDPAKRAYYAKHRQIRFAARFGNVSKETTHKASQTHQAARSLEIGTTLRPENRAVFVDTVDA